MTFRTFVPIGIAALALSACSADSGDGKEVAELKAELQRAERDNETQREKVATLERRLGGLAEDVARVRRTSADAAIVAAAKSDAPATDAAIAAPGTAGASPAVAIDATAMKTYFDSKEGRAEFAAAYKALQDQQEVDRANKAVDNILSRLSKEANLTEDQSRRMRDILAKSAVQLREITQSFRDGPMGDPQDIRQKFTDLKTSTDTQVKGVLDDIQFAAYQKIVPQAGGFGGFGGGGRPRGGQGGQGGQAGQNGGN